MKYSLIYLLIFCITSCDNRNKSEIANSSLTFDGKQSRSEIESLEVKSYTENSFESKNYESIIMSGENFLIKNDFEKAVIEFKKAIKLDSTRIEGHYGSGVAMSMLCFHENNYCDEAILELRKVLKIKDDYRRTYYNLSICLTKMLDFNGALNAINKAIESNSSDPDYYSNRGYLLLIKRDTSKACVDFQTALKKGGNDIPSKFMEFCK